MNYITHNDGTFRLWNEEPRWDGGDWVSKCGEDPQATDRRTAERIMRRKAHKCECYRIDNKTSIIIFYIKNNKL